MAHGEGESYATHNEEDCAMGSRESQGKDSCGLGKPAAPPETHSLRDHTRSLRNHAHGLRDHTRRLRNHTQWAGKGIGGPD